MARSLCVACFLGATLVVQILAPAAAVELQPGLWELTTKVDRNGAVSMRPPRSKCITAEKANAARTKTDLDIIAGVKAKLSAPSGRDACKLVDAKNSPDLMTWRLQCTAGSSSAEQEITARFDSPRHYVVVIRSSITFLNKTLTSVSTTEGQHKGECRR